MNIPLPETKELSIYDYGFSKSLYRTIAEGDSALVYNIQEDTTNPTLLSFGAINVGKNENVLVASDEGLQVGSIDFASAPFSVDMSGSVSIGTGNNKLLWDNINLSVGGGIRGETYVSDTLLNSADTVRDIVPAVYTNTKQMTVYFSGTLRIKFSLILSVAYGKIYRNDVAIGTERFGNNTDWEEFSEDLGGWSIGDRCQIYTKQTGAGAPKLKNFRMYGSYHKITTDID